MLLFQIRKSERAGLLVALRIEDLSEQAQLLVHGKRGDLIVRIFQRCQRLQPRRQATRQLLGHERRTVRAGRQVRELRRHLLHRIPAEKAHAGARDVAEVAARELEGCHGRVDGVQALKRHVAFTHAAPSGKKRHQELLPGEDFRVALAEIGQHAVDVAAEHRVRRDEEYLGGIQRAAMLVEQIRDALHEHRSLARPGDARHLQHRHVLVAHHGVLLALDGACDGLHVGRAPAGKRGEQQLVLDGHVRVEVGDEAVFLDFELAAQLEIHMDGAPVGHIGGRAHGLVVVHLGHGAAPIHDQAPVVLVRNARRTDIKLLGRSALLELQGDLREVGLAKQHLHRAQTLGLHGVGHIVGLDDVVHGHDIGVGLQDIVPGGEVHGQLLGHVLLVLGGLGRHSFHGGQRIATDLLQLAVGLTQVRLLGGEDGIVGSCLTRGRGATKVAPYGRGVGALLLFPRQGRPRSGRSCAVRPGRRCPRASSCAR